MHKISLPHLPLAMTRRNFLEAERYGALREAWARTTSCAQRYHCDELIPTLVVLLLQLGEGAPFEPAPFRLEVFGKHKLKFSYWTYQKVNPQPQYYHPKRGRLVRQCADSRGHNVL